MKSVTIARHKISSDTSPFVIAEAGVNHQGRLDLALRLIDAAAEAGADAIKFQTFRAEEVAIAATPLVKYQRGQRRISNSQLELLKELELKDEHYPSLMERARQRKIVFLSTPHGGFRTIDFLARLGVPAFKFGSGDLTNLPLLRYAARFGKPMIISTGMATLSEVKKAVAAVGGVGNRNIVVLHCTTEYPCPPAQANLRAMQTMMRELTMPVGYSDHTLGIQTAIMAVTLGACMIEKHLTLDKTMHGPDHKASADPQEFQSLVSALKTVRAILGSPVKRPAPSEVRTMPLVRKSVVALRSIKKGETFTSFNIGIKRPGTGLAPEYYDELLGRKAKRGIPADTLIHEHDFR